MKINDFHDIDGLFNIHLQITDICHHNCIGCYQDHNKNNITKINALTAIQEILKDRNPKEFKITFFGGEPLIMIHLIIDIITDLKIILSDYPNNKLKELVIPTSGFVTQKDGGETILKNLPKLLTIKPNNTKLKICISHDGPKNKIYRNIDEHKVVQLINKIREYEILFKEKILNTTISCVIPNNIDEDYFIETFEYFSKVLHIPCTFTIPHLLTNFSFESIVNIFKPSIKKFLDKYYDTKEWNRYPPKLFDEILTKIRYKHKYNWCTAGVNHLAIKPNGVIVDCEFLTESSKVLLDKLDQRCKNCEIEAYCQRPCLKNIEVDKTELIKQCTIRKILFMEMRNILQIKLKEKHNG